MRYSMGVPREDKKPAYSAYQRALRSGDLVRPERCQRCGVAPTKKLQGHHTDYKKPLEVKWLCSGCHGLVHRSPLIWENGVELELISIKLSAALLSELDKYRHSRSAGEFTPTRQDIVREALAWFLDKADKAVAAQEEE